MKAINCNPYKRKVKSGDRIGQVINSFRYHVIGTEAELEAFENAMGDRFVLDEETGQPLWFTDTSYGNEIGLVITNKGKVVADNKQAIIDAEEVASFGGNYGAELAKAMVALRMNARTVKTAVTTVATEVAVKEVTEDVADL